MRQRSGPQATRQGNGDAIRDTGQKGGALDTLRLMGTKGGAIMNVEAESDLIPKTFYRERTRRRHRRRTSIHNATHVIRKKARATKDPHVVSRWEVRTYL